MKRRVFAAVLGLLFLAWLAGVLVQNLGLVPPEAKPSAAAPAATPRPTTAPTRPPTAAPTPTLTTVGDVTQAGNWEISLVKVETSQRIRGALAQGIFTTMTIGARNLHKEISQLHDHDFFVTAPGGTKFTTADPGMMALDGSVGPVVLLLGVQIQPSLVKQFRVVFDLNPTMSGYVLHAAEIPFRFSIDR